MNSKTLQAERKRWYNGERTHKVRAVIWRAAKLFRLLFLPDFKALWRLARNDYPGGLKAGLVTEDVIAAWQRATKPARKIHASFAKIKPQVLLAWYLCALIFGVLAI